MDFMGGAGDGEQAICAQTAKKKRLRQKNRGISLLLCITFVTFFLSDGPDRPSLEIA
jgi:hypothetical protein